MGYINFAAGNFNEAKKRFRLVTKIKQEEKAYFLKLIKNTIEKIDEKSRVIDYNPPKKDKEKIDYSGYKEYTFKIPIKILLGKINKKISVSTDKQIKIKLYEKGKKKTTYSNSSFTQTISTESGNLLLNKNKKYSKIEFVSLNNSLIKVNSKSYRGKIIITQNKKKFLIINEVNIEDYLKGVLKKEINVNWNEEVLKAQAVAARTFAYHHLLNKNSKLYHIGNNWLSQEYGGADAENVLTSMAVDKTKGIIMTCMGKPILAYFHADSGGYTETSKNVWGKEAPYIISKRDKYGVRSPKRYWQCKISELKLRKILNLKGYKIGKIKKIKAINRTRSGRFKTIKIIHSRGTKTIDSNKFRLMVGSQFVVKSTMFVSIKKRRDTFYFKGRGSGHGVGMPQWSAKEMGEKGKNYKKILGYYYRKINLEKI